MSLASVHSTAQPPGYGVFHDILLVYTNPVRLFFNLPRANRGGTALLLLVLLLGFIGWLIGEIGIHEQRIRYATDNAATQILLNARSEENPAAAYENADLVTKSAEFSVLMTRGLMIIGPPLRVLITIGLLGGILFALVALGGGKPKMSMLAAIVTFSSFVEVPRQALRAYLIHATHQIRVETSMAAIPNHLGQSGISLGEYLLLRRLDPFDLWFWTLFFVGVHLATRMSVFRSLLLTVLLAIPLAGLRMLEDLSEIAIITMKFGPQ